MNCDKILIITRNLPPLVGGMERLNWHMADELSKYAHVKVVGPQGSTHSKPERVHLTEAPLKPLALFLAVAFLKAIWLAVRWRPDVILAGSGLTAPLAWLASKLCGARSAAYLHGLDITVKDKVYQRFWTPTFCKIDHIIVNSTPTKRLAFAAGVPERKISIVHPGVTLPGDPQPAEAILAFKEQHGLVQKKILLSVGRLTTRKGLREFVEFSLPEIVRAAPDVMLVVIGDAPLNALSADTQSVESIKQQAELSGVERHLLFLGRVSEQELALAYEAADVHVFPVREIPGDPEGFGMVAIEAAAHGLPTIAFAVGGVVDAIGEEESGHLCSSGNYAEFSFKVVSIIARPLHPATLKSFILRFSWNYFGAHVKKSLS